MINRFEFAQNINTWLNEISDKINELNLDTQKSPLLEALNPLKSNLGLLAFYITGSLDENKENELIDHVLKACETLKTADLSINFQELYVLVNEYKTKKINPPKQNIDDIVSKFNNMTKQSAERAKLFSEASQSDQNQPTNTSEKSGPTINCPKIKTGFPTI